MECIDTSFAVRCKFIDAVRDPSGPVASDHFDAGKLFVRKLAVELHEHCFPMSFTDPYHSIGIMVDYDGDIFVAFLIAGLIDADLFESIKTSGSFRLKVFKGPGDAVPDRLPIDAHVVGDSASGKVFCKPGDSHIKVSGKAAVRVCPRNSGCHGAVFRTADPLRLGFNLHKDASQIQSSPSFRISGGLVVSGTSSSAEGTDLLMPLVWPYPDAQVLYIVNVSEERVGLYNNSVDIDKLFQYSIS